MNLNLFMSTGIERILKTAGRFYLKSKKGRAFLAGMVPKMRASAKLREQSEASGVHVPAFLIASVASQCNLHCAGCYARAGGACCDADVSPDLTGPEWAGVFGQAASLGVSFVLLAGGEPLTRRDVLLAAAARPGMVFPVFTNGTMMDDDYMQLFDDHRNLVPVLSIEGGETETDARRGVGTYAKIRAAMGQLKAKNMLFGVSITVTSQNLHTVLSEEFAAELRDLGCGIAIYVEYVPAQPGTDYLALSPDELEVLNHQSLRLKAAFNDMVVLSFPGDEAAMGGCLASGRGFFHINPKGGAEPCPFSPYAKHNVRQMSLEQVLRSRYFEDLRRISAEAGPHTGGCVLFQREGEVKRLLAQ